MKTLISLHKAFILFIILICVGSLVKAQTINKDVPFNLAINQTGINRVIAAQWNSIQTQWFGNYQGVSYEITLNRPVVSLFENKITITLSLDIASSVYIGEASISPSLTTPTLSSSTQEIITSYSNLRSAIDTVTAFNDSRLNDILEDILEPIDWVVFKGGILDAFTGRFSDTSDLEWVDDTSLDFSVAPGELLLIITPAIVATSPKYTFKFRRNSSTRDYQIRSNNKISLEAVWLKVSVLGSEVSSETDISISSSYDSSTDEYVIY